MDLIESISGEHRASELACSRKVLYMVIFAGVSPPQVSTTPSFGGGTDGSPVLRYHTRPYPVLRGMFDCTGGVHTTVLPIPVLARYPPAAPLLSNILQILVRIKQATRGELFVLALYRSRSKFLSRLERTIMLTPRRRLFSFFLASRQEQHT